MTDPANLAQIRAIADTVAEAAVMKFYQTHVLPVPTPESSIPAPLKWAGGIFAAVMTAAIIAFLLWMATTLSDLQQTVTRIDERQKTADPALSRRFDDIERRVGVLEGYHHGGREK